METLSADEALLYVARLDVMCAFYARFTDYLSAEAWRDLVVASVVAAERLQCRDALLSVFRVHTVFYGPQRLALWNADIALIQLATARHCGPPRAEAEAEAEAVPSPPTPARKRATPEVAPHDRGARLAKRRCLSPTPAPAPSPSLELCTPPTSPSATAPTPVPVPVPAPVPAPRPPVFDFARVIDYIDNHTLRTRPHCCYCAGSAPAACAIHSAPPRVECYYGALQRYETRYVAASWYNVAALMEEAHSARAARAVARQRGAGAGASTGALVVGAGDASAAAASHCCAAESAATHHGPEAPRVAVLAAADAQQPEH